MADTKEQQPINNLADIVIVLQGILKQLTELNQSLKAIAQSQAQIASQSVRR